MSFPDNTFWLRLAGTVGMEAAVVVGVVFIMQLFVHAPAWRRALWQMAVILMLVGLASELSGFGRGVGALVWGDLPAERTMPVQVSLAPAVSGTSSQPVAVNRPPSVLAAQSDATAWWPGVLWGAGIALVLLRIAFAQGLFCVLRWRRLTMNDADLTRRVAEIARRQGLSRKVHLIHAPGLNTPIAFGLMRPCIGLPSEFATEFSREQQDAMLAHELAHLASRDPLWYLLADVVAACLWWQPLVWWARRRLHATSELAADEATALLENGPETLAECLVRLGRQAISRRRWAWMGVDGGFRSNLGQRVERLLALRKNPGGPIRRWLLFFILTGATLILALVLVLLSGWLQGEGASRQPTWGSTLKQSWGHSGAGRIFAMLDNKPKEKVRTLPASQRPSPDMYIGSNSLPANFQEWPLVDSIIPDKLVTKIFHIDPEMFRNSLTNTAGYNSTNLQQFHSALRKVFEDAGVHLNPPKVVYYHDRNGLVFVKVSSDDMPLIEKALKKFNPLAPAQIVIEAAFVEMDTGIEGRNVSTSTLTPSEYRDLIGSLTNRPGANLFGIPKITTLSGRQTRLSVMENDPPEAVGPTFEPASKAQLEILPQLRLDGSIQMGNTMVIARAPSLPGTPMLSRLWVTAATNSVRDGDTLMLEGMTAGGMTANKHGVKKYLTVFITPTLVDPAGNPMKRRTGFNPH